MHSSTTSSTTREAASPVHLVPAGSSTRPLGWTPERVGARLVAAYRTLDLLPRDTGPRAAGNHWPAHRIEFADRIAEAELPAAERCERERRRNDRAFRPSGADIADMDRALDWLRRLRETDDDLASLLMLWAFRVARGRSLRALCREQGWAPHDFYRRRDRALDIVATRLEQSGTAFS